MAVHYAQIHRVLVRARYVSTKGFFFFFRFCVFHGPCVSRLQCQCDTAAMQTSDNVRGCDIFFNLKTEREYLFRLKKKASSPPSYPVNHVHVSKISNVPLLGLHYLCHVGHCNLSINQKDIFFGCEQDCSLHIHKTDQHNSDNHAVCNM